ncbi:MAG: trigger factor [Beijerinckiaceae bacterium]|nr:trigger factor [Beijerinckiaceae bacterium]
MQVEQTQAQGLKHEFKVVLSSADLAQRIDGQLAEMKAKARIPGFRPGKVPVSHLKRLYGRSIIAEVVQDAVNEANRKIVEDNQLRLAVEPKVDFACDANDLEKIVEAKEDFAFTVALEVLPKIEVNGFGEIEIERLVAEVSPGDVDQVLTRLAETNRAFILKEGEAVAEAGDKATLDFSGTVDGEPFAGGSRDNTDVVIGSGGFLPGFETQIIGMKTGEYRTVTAQFPDTYSVAELAGKLATFEVTLKSVSAPASIEVSDDLARGLGFEDLAKLKEAIRSNIEGDYSAASRARWKRGLLDALDRKFLFDVPESMVAQEFETIWRKVEAEQRQSGHSYEEDGTTEDAARADYHKIAERRVRLGLLLAEVGERAEIKVSDEEVAQAVARRARAFRGEEKIVWDYYRKNPGALAAVRAPLFEDKVIDYVISQVKLRDKQVSKEELLHSADTEETGATVEGAAETLPG